jgi:predicted DNA-binding transcriptional regulator AlpA
MNQIPVTLNSDLLTTEQAAEFLGLSPSTLNTWRCRGTVEIPGLVRIGRAVRYSRLALTQFIESGGSTSQLTGGGK